MCGIAGFFDRPKDWKTDIEKMNRRMRHRGPDASGSWCSEDKRVVLGHVRLSVVELSEAGSQPMHSADDRYVMVYNGEIYNHKELRERLIKDGKCKAFRGHSDTEVLLEMVCAYGFEEALKSATGMFAAAVYDKKERCLYLGRDRIGEKPLYYGFVDGHFIFASDIGCIMEIVGDKLTMDRDALALYFRHGCFPAPFTIAKEIQKLEPGAVLELREPFLPQDVKINKYWDIMEVARNAKAHPFTGTEEEAADELDRLLRNAVAGQMEADVPVGAFLSGGIDSSTVVSVMQQLSARRVKTFSIGFHEAAYNEADAAKQIAAHLGTDHTELYVTADDVMDLIPKMAGIYSEPFADASQLPTFLVSKLAREKVTVSLSGDGGDELFCGYHSYRSIAKVWGKIHNIPRGIRVASKALISAVAQGDATYIGKVARYLDAATPEDIYIRMAIASSGSDYLVKDAGIPAYSYSEYPRGYIKESMEENIMLMDMLLYHPDDILVKVDRSAMAVSLESRVPLLDKDVVEFAWSLPLSYKADADTTKKVLRNVLYRYVPKALMDRPKQGFGVPVSEWIRTGKLRGWAEELLSEERIRREGILRPEVVRRMWNNFLRNESNAGHIWFLLMFEEWMNHGGLYHTAG